MTQATQQPASEKTQRTKGDKLALEIGTRMAVTLDGFQQGPERRTAADLADIVPFAYISLCLPSVPGSPPRPVGVASVTSRFLRTGAPRACQASVTTPIAKPSPLPFLL